MPQHNPIYTKTKAPDIAIRISFKSATKKWKFTDFLLIPKQIKYELKSALVKLWQPWE